MSAHWLINGCFAHKKQRLCYLVKKDRHFGHHSRPCLQSPCQICHSTRPDIQGHSAPSKAPYKHTMAADSMYIDSMDPVAHCPNHCFSHSNKGRVQLRTMKDKAIQTRKQRGDHHLLISHRELISLLDLTAPSFLPTQNLKKTTM